MAERAEAGKEKDNEGPREVYSKVVRAGRRTYFFDVKATRDDDYFLTIAESRKIANKWGAEHYEKHKIHLYKEDFIKYLEGLTDAIEYIKSESPRYSSVNES